MRQLAQRAQEEAENEPENSTIPELRLERTSTPVEAACGHTIQPRNKELNQRGIVVHVGNPVTHKLCARCFVARYGGKITDTW